MQNRIKVLGAAEYHQPKTVDVKMLLFLYQTGSGRFVLHAFLVWRWFSRLYAVYYNSRLSIRDIAPFIKEHSIDMSLYEQQPYRSFNDFFLRVFKNGMRPFVSDAYAMPALCEAFYTAWESIGLYQPVMVKGQHYSVSQLFQREEEAIPFINGPLVIARLAPYHYHWFHHIDDGVIIAQYHVPGQLHSVDPIALGRKPDILLTNKRDITIVQTANFGKIAYIEVGALTVGKIVQLNKVSDRVKRGDKKGYFSFGGSTVLIIGEKGMWNPGNELIENTANGMETSVLLGSAIARSNEKK